MEWLVKDSMERRKTTPRQSGMKKDIMDRWLRTERNEERYHQDRMERRKTPWSGWPRTEWNEERHHGPLAKDRTE